jgi:hypothetical protein
VRFRSAERRHAQLHTARADPIGRAVRIDPIGDAMRKALRTGTSMLTKLFRVIIISALVFMLAACGGENSGVAPGPSDAGTNDALDDAGLITCPFETPLEFGRIGFVADPGAINRAAGCLKDTLFRYARWMQGHPQSTLVSQWCWSEPTPCGPGSTLAAVHESLIDPEIAAALAHEPPAVYGLDRRNVNDGMFVVRWGTDCSKRLTTAKGLDLGRGFDVGPACADVTPDCHPIPRAIALFVERLEELERQKRSESVCFGL